MSYAFAHGQFGLALAFQGRIDEAIAEEARRRARSPLAADPGRCRDGIHVPGTIDYMEKAHADDSQWMGWLKHDHVFDPLRGEPRFVALLSKLGFER